MAKGNSYASVEQTCCQVNVRRINNHISNIYSLVKKDFYRYIITLLLLLGTICIIHKSVKLKKK